jgi:hypothetical protein
MATPPPAIDYTDKDFRSLRSALLRLAQQRLPEWTDQSPADLGSLLVDLFAYMGDVLLYYQDRIASEFFPSTAVERRSIVDLLRLIGYELTPASPAMADLLLTFAAPTGPVVVTIPRGCRFTARPRDGEPLEFTYLGPALDLALGSDQVRPGTNADGDPVVHYDGLPVEQGTSVGPVIVGSSSGEPNQTFPLPDRLVVFDSVIVEVDEGAGWVRWDRRESLLFDIAADGRAELSSPDARHYQLQVGGDGVCRVVFGAGRRPPAGSDNVRASYRACQGAAGNLAAGTIEQALTAVAGLLAVTNPAEAAGGRDEERSDHAIRFGPYAFRSGNRAVTETDYVALAQATGAVAKVRAHSQAWNRIDLHVAPAGPSWRPVPESLRHRLLGYFEHKRMAGTVVRVLDARGVPVDIALDLLVDARFGTDAVASQVESAVSALLAFERVDFGQTAFASDVYAAAEGVPGVIAVVVRRFRRRDRPPIDIDAELARHNLPTREQLPAFLRDAVSGEIAPEGRIEIGEFEIPVLGEIVIATRTAAP